MSSLCGSSCFEVVKNTLDILYDKLPAKTRDDDIQLELKQLSDSYKGLKVGGTIDYSKPATQFAYLYCYVTSHANTTYELLLKEEESSQLVSIFNQEEVNVVCLGGGPGSDLLGLIKFMEVHKKKAKLVCAIYDKEKNWQDTWQCVFKGFKASFPCKIGFRYLDVYKHTVSECHAKSENVDLYTMSFLLSEVCSNKEQAHPFFLDLFNRAKVGSRFLFIDNVSVEAHTWFDSIVTHYNQSCWDYSIDVLYQGNRQEFRLESREQKTGLEPYYSKFCKQGSLHGGNPRLGASVNYRICVKQ